MKKTTLFSILMIIMMLFIACNEPEGDDYTLVLHGNGRDNWSEATDTELYETEGTDVTLPGAGDYTRLGFSFADWNTEADGSGTSYIQGDQFTMPAEACTLYAQWEFAPAIVLYRDMTTISGGTFDHTQWSYISESGVSFSHTVSSFMIAKYELTYELWYVVKHWAEQRNYYFEHDGEEGGGIGGWFPITKYEPVTTISWEDAVVWCNAYNELLELDPVYLDEDENVIKDSRSSNSSTFDAMIWDHTANGYRLPSEGEWRYAASDRGTTAADHAVGCSADYTDTTATKLVAWYNMNAYYTGGVSQDDPDWGIHLVGTRDPNTLDLYDMSGNTSEYVWDWKADLPTSAQSNYYGPETGTLKVTLGGGWSSYGHSIVIGATGSCGRGNVSGGFRLAKNSD